MYFSTHHSCRRWLTFLYPILPPSLLFRMSSTGCRRRFSRSLSQFPNGAALSGRTRPALVSNKNVAAAYASGIVALVINARNAVLVRIGPPFKDALLYRCRVLATRFQVSTARQRLILGFTRKLQSQHSTKNLGNNHRRRSVRHSRGYLLPHLGQGSISGIIYLVPPFVSLLL